MNPLRSTAERLSRGWVLRRKLPKTFGGARLFVSPESGGLKYWRLDLAKVDPELLRLVDEFVKPGANVWDVGANVGLFAFAAAHRAGPSGSVLAIDADVECAALLVRSARVNAERPNAPVAVLPCAIVDDPTQRTATFQISGRSRAMNALLGFGMTQAGPARERRSVPATTLDTLLGDFPAPDVLKIDVEGAELGVLAGASKVLAEHRPVILVEVGGNHSVDAASRLHSAGYEIFDGGLPLDRRTPLSSAAWTTIAVPRR